VAENSSWHVFWQVEPCALDEPEAETVFKTSPMWVNHAARGSSGTVGGTGRQPSGPLPRDWTTTSAFDTGVGNVPCWRGSVRALDEKEASVADVTPHIVVRDAGRAAEWYERALGAEIGSRIPVPDGRFMQIELLFGDSPVMVADEFPEWGAVSPLTLGGTYGALTITTDAVDELWERALAAGAQVYSPLQDAFWGERHGQIIDPFGHRWGLAQHLEDVPQDEIVRRAAELFGAAS
jgi:PhnB protein